MKKAGSERSLLLTFWGTRHIMILTVFTADQSRIGGR